MKVLRANKDSLMNVLETFLHDPLVEWIKKQDEVTLICKVTLKFLIQDVILLTSDTDRQ